MLKFGVLLVYVAVAVGAARADPMVCTTDAGVTHCEAPLRHYRVTGTRKGNRTYFEDNNRHTDIGGPKRMKTGRCVRRARANGAPC
jgi:hypothetical protein